MKKITMSRQPSKSKAKNGLAIFGVSQGVTLKPQRLSFGILVPITLPIWGDSTIQMYGNFFSIVQDVWAGFKKNDALYFGKPFNGNMFKDPICLGHLFSPEESHRKTTEHQNIPASSK